MDRTHHFHGLMSSTSQESRLELVATGIALDFEAGPSVPPQYSEECEKMLWLVLKQVREKV